MNLAGAWNCRLEGLPDVASGLAAVAEASATPDPYKVLFVDHDLVPALKVVASDALPIIALVPLGTRVLPGVGMLTKPIKRREFLRCLTGVMSGSAVGAQHRRRGQQRQAQGHAQLENTRVLVAEDNPTNQRVVMAFLKKLGCVAEVVDNGAEAVARLREKPFDIVLMDCQMPIMDGYEATGRIRNQKSGALNSSIPIVAVTANALQGDRETCLAAGMTDYLTKPIKRIELAKVLKRVLADPSLGVDPALRVDQGEPVLS